MAWQFTDSITDNVHTSRCPSGSGSAVRARPRLRSARLPASDALKSRERVKVHVMRPQPAGLARVATDAKRVEVYPVVFVCLGCWIRKTRLFRTPCSFKVSCLACPHPFDMFFLPLHVANH